MNQSITILEGQNPVVMKSGLVHWISDETKNKIQRHLDNQTSHTFMRILELSITINTAEIEGIYTLSQYEDLCKVKQGMWQCEYKNWHNKGKRECECKKEFYSKIENDQRKKQYEEENRVMTNEEKSKSYGKLKNIGDELRKNGFLPPICEDKNIQV